VLLALAIGASVPLAAQTRDITAEAKWAERRVALVVGNGSYPTSPLRNPRNDARAMARALRDLGFEVLMREDLDDKAFRRAIEDFGDLLRGGGVGMFFFAGHGLQISGRNYLVPIDAQIRTERDVEIETIDLARVLARMEEARNRLNIVILDACRDNPFGRSFRSIARGLAATDAPTGTLIAYSTAPGRTARDGDGEHGVYTAELLKAMRVPGLRIEDVFKRVRQAVRQQTRDTQVPWEASSLEGDFVFMPTAAARVAVSPPPVAPAPPVLPAPPPASSPSGFQAFVGRWTEHWPGLPYNDTYVVTYVDGRLVVEAWHSGTRQSVSEVRLDGETLKFNHQTSGNEVPYEIRVRGRDELSVRAQGSSGWNDKIVWRRAK
jgi:hypothetical protein